MRKYINLTSHFPNCKLFTFLVGIFLLHSCEVPPDARGQAIVIQNNSNINIHYYLPDIDSQYPNLNLPIEPPELWRIRPESYFIDYLIPRGDPNSNYFDQLLTDTFSVFIFDAEIYKQTDWEEIRDSHLVLKRIDMTEQNLKDSSYRVKYE